RAIEREGDLRADVQRDVPVHFAFALEEAVEWLAVDELHRDVRRAGFDPGRINPHDVWMIQWRGRLRLLVKLLDDGRRPREAAQQDFERDVAIELGVAREINGAHGAAADKSVDLIPAELGSDQRTLRAGFGRHQ